MKQLELNRNFDRVLKTASKGKIEEIQALLSKYKTILNRPSEGHNRTLLWESVNSNRNELSKYLMEQGANVNIPGRYRSQNYVLLKPYCIAHQKKNEEIRNILKKNGHEMDIFSITYLGLEEELHEKIKKDKGLINQKQEEDKLWNVTPLHFAVSSNNVDMVNIILKLGAEVAQHSKLLYEIACRNNRLDIINLLTKYGGNPKVVDVPPVFYKNNKEIINFFIANGLNCDKHFGMNWPPIVYLCRGDKGEHPNKIRKLLKHVKDVNAKTPKGVSAMHASSKAGYLTVLKILLQNGGEINIRDNRGKTPLHYARKYKRKEVEQYLLQNGGIE